MKKPPLDITTLEAISTECANAHNTKAVEDKLSAMANAFEGRGKANSWTEVLLGKIDECFRKNYCLDSGVPCDLLFFPEEPDNFNRFTQYCSDVDKVLLEEADEVPRYAREYFTYSMIWKVHGHKFPIPLGTATVIEAVHHLAMKYQCGLSEVSTASCLTYHKLVSEICSITKYGHYAAHLEHSEVLRNSMYKLRGTSWTHVQKCAA